MIALLAGLALGQDAPAAPTMDLQRWLVPLDGRGTLATVDAADAPRGWYGMNLVGSWQHAPVVYEWDDGTEELLVEDVFGTELDAAGSLGRLVGGVRVPMLLGVSGTVADTPVALGDMSLEAKGVVLDHDSPVGVAVLGRLRLPTTAGANTGWASGRTNRNCRSTAFCGRRTTSSPGSPASPSPR